MTNQSIGRTTSILRGVFFVGAVGTLVLSAWSFVHSEGIWEKLLFVEAGIVGLVMLASAAWNLGNLFTSQKQQVELPPVLGCFGAISMVTSVLSLLVLLPIVHDPNRVMVFELLSLPFCTFLAAVTALLIVRRLHDGGVSPRP